MNKSPVCNYVQYIHARDLCNRQIPQKRTHEFGKAFRKPMQDGVALLNAIQDVYLDKAVTVA
ncbi:MAG: hypothetical protein A2V79_07920 [Betaproteobacteria bacterium RBG_16_56_24]|nr:MAG: hypothetical protein A2V79_07920 [Betaproteobacteria bacterium RBG_16_56_24]